MTHVRLTGRKNRACAFPRPVRRENTKGKIPSKNMAGVEAPLLFRVTSVKMSVCVPQGSCDEGKQYCCYNDFDGPNSGSKELLDKYGGDRSEPVPSVLVGPGSSRPGLRPGIYGQVSNKNVRIANCKCMNYAY